MPFIKYLSDNIIPIYVKFQNENIEGRKLQRIT